MTRAEQQSRIPKHQSLEDEAAFWDFHSAAEFEDELEVVTDVRFVKPNRQQSLDVPLDDDQLTALKVRAREQGLDPSSLVKTWILEHLRA